VLAAFEASTNNELTQSSLDGWERQAEKVAGELRLLTDGAALYEIYSSLLKKAAPQVLDPLQMATFELLSGAVVDAQIRNFPKGTAVTALIDEATEVHLKFIEDFKTEIDDGGSDGYSQSTQQEFLGYQFAGLVERFYTRFSKGLGADFDSSSTAVSMRISNWVSPVYARLQRRFVRFLAGNVEEKMEEINAQAFDRLLDKIVVEISPRYRLLQGGAAVSSSSTDSSSSYPAWDLTSFISKVLRNTMGSQPLASVEPKVARLLQNDLSVKMRALGRPLEQLAAKMSDKRFRMGSLEAREVQVLEDMLALGHVSAAAVFTVWQVRHNLVGVPEDPQIGYEGKLDKDFLVPLALYPDSANTINAIPKGLRVNAEAAVEEVSAFCKPSPSGELVSAALVAHAARVTAAEEFRALITYNSDPSEWPASRDASFVAVQSAVLMEALAEPVFSQRRLLEHLVAMAALEETVGVREPRGACEASFEYALKAAVLAKLPSSSSSDNGATQEFAQRVAAVESALGMMSRLPEGSGSKIRLAAFKAVVDAMLAQSPPGETAAALKRIEAVTPAVASMLSVDVSQAQKYVAPLARSIFDRSVGSLLVSAEITAAGKASQGAEAEKMGAMLRQQVQTLAQDLSLSADEADERTGYLGGAVFESLLETALEEHRRMSVDRAELAMLRAYALCRHPLLTATSAARSSSPSSPSSSSSSSSSSSPAVVVGDETLDVGVKMTLARLGTARLSEVMRLTEVLRSRQPGGPASSSDSGWGAVAAAGSAAGAAAADAGYGAFLAALQDKLLREFSKASMKSFMNR